MLLYGDKAYVLYSKRELQCDRIQPARPPADIFDNDAFHAPTKKYRDKAENDSPPPTVPIKVLIANCTSVIEEEKKMPGKGGSPMKKEDTTLAQREWQSERCGGVAALNNITPSCMYKPKMDKLSQMIIQLSNKFEDVPSIYERMKKQTISTSSFKSDYGDMTAYFQVYGDMIKQTFTSEYGKHMQVLERCKRIYEEKQFPNINDVLKALKSCTITELQCGHRLGSQEARMRAKELLEAMPTGALQFKCPVKECYYIVNDSELIEALEKYYATFTLNYRVSAYS